MIAKTRGEIVSEIIMELNDYGSPTWLGNTLQPSTLTITVTDASKVTSESVLEIDQELILGPSITPSGTLVTVQKRGYMGTTGVAHANGTMVRINPIYKQEIIIRLINACLTTELRKINIDDTSITTAANTVHYDLPVGVTSDNLKGVFLKSSTNDLTAKTGDRIERYRINVGQGVGGLDQLELGFYPPQSHYITLEYDGGFQELDSDAATTNLPLNEAAYRLPTLYTCAKLLNIRENARLRFDNNPSSQGATPPWARQKGAALYWDEFVRLRKELHLMPLRTVPIKVGW